MNRFLLKAALLSVIILSGCGETVRLRTFTADELDQIRIVSYGDYKVFPIPGKDWKIRAYLPGYRVTKWSSVLFQAGRHYDGDEMIVVAASILDLELNLKDLKSCLDYRTGLSSNKNRHVVEEKDRAVISQDDDDLKVLTILNYHDGLCIDTLIVVSGINAGNRQRALENTQRLADSLHIIPR